MSLLLDDEGMREFLLSLMNGMVNISFEDLLQPIMGFQRIV